MPALSTTRPLVLVCLLTNELLNKLNLNLEPPWEARFLKRKPSEYMTSDEFFYALNWRSLLSLCIQRIGAQTHWDTSWPNTVKMFKGREDISESHKRQIKRMRLRQALLPAKKEY